MSTFAFMETSLDKVVLPFTNIVEARVVALVTVNVLFKIDVRFTTSVEDNVVALDTDRVSFNVDAPVTVNVEAKLVALETDRVSFNVDVRLTVNVEANTSYQLPPASVKPASYNKANACDCYIEPDSTYTLAMQPNDDGSTGIIPIPFTFNLYGQSYNNIYINNSGNLTFTGPMSTFSATAFPSVGGRRMTNCWALMTTFSHACIAGSGG